MIWDRAIEVDRLYGDRGAAFVASQLARLGEGDAQGRAFWTDVDKTLRALRTFAEPCSTPFSDMQRTGCAAPPRRDSLLPVRFNR